jgi:hypothetical protein
MTLHGTTTSVHAAGRHHRRGDPLRRRDRRTNGGISTVRHDRAFWNRRDWPRTWVAKSRLVTIGELDRVSILMNKTILYHPTLTLSCSRRDQICEIDPIACIAFLDSATDNVPENEITDTAVLFLDPR